MASSFSVSGVTATFQVTTSSYGDKLGPAEEFTSKIIVDDPTTWGALASLRSWNVNVRAIPKRVGVPSKVLVQVGGGAGEGALDFEGTSYTAVLMELRGEAPEADGNKRAADATFLITAG